MKVDLYRDWRRASETVNMLEHKHALKVLEPRNAETGERGYHRAELHRAAREGATELDRELPARRVRACAVASKTEAEFVRRLRGQGLIVRPSLASGRNDVVGGDKVAVRPSKEHGAKRRRPSRKGLVAAPPAEGMGRAPPPHPRRSRSGTSPAVTCPPPRTAAPNALSRRRRLKPRGALIRRSRPRMTHVDWWHWTPPVTRGRRRSRAAPLSLRN